MSVKSQASELVKGRLWISWQSASSILKLIGCLHLSILSSQFLEIGPKALSKGAKTHS